MNIAISIKMQSSHEDSTLIHFLIVLYEDSNNCHKYSSYMSYEE